MQSTVKDPKSQKKLNLELDYKKHQIIDPTLRSNSEPFVNYPLKLINNKPTHVSSLTKTSANKNNQCLKVKIEITENSRKDFTADLKNTSQKYNFLID